MLSPFSFLIQTKLRVFPHSILFTGYFLFSVPWVFLCFRHHLLFISEITPDSISHSLVVCLWISASRGSVEGFNISQPPPFICPDFCLLISCMGSQLLMKSQSVLRAVTWSRVKGFWPLVAASLWCLLTLGSLGWKELGREGCPSFSFFVLFHIWNFTTFAVSCYKRHLCFYLSILWAMNVPPTVTFITLHSHINSLLHQTRSFDRLKISWKNKVWSFN